MEEHLSKPKIARAAENGRNFGMTWRCKFLHRQSFTSKDLSPTITRGMANQMASITCWNAEKNAERRLNKYLVALRERQSMSHKTTCKFVSDHFSFSLVNFPFLSRSIPAYLTVRIKYSFFSFRASLPNKYLHR